MTVLRCSRNSSRKEDDRHHWINQKLSIGLKSIKELTWNMNRLYFKAITTNYESNINSIDPSDTHVFIV